MSTAVERFDEGARRRVDALGRTIVRGDELLRHPVYTRVVHWTVAAFLILSLLSGFALYSAWLYRVLTPLFGGGPRTRLLHQWFGLAFVVVFALEFLNWLEPMTWTSDDRRWLQHLRRYVTNADEREPEYVGFFNAGQKLYFWIIAASAVVVLITGILMWFPATFGRIAVAVSYVLHDLAALLLLGSFITHLYESTAQQPGTFRSMTRGTVERRWAWTHHPAWYRRVTAAETAPPREGAQTRVVPPAEPGTR